MLVSGKSRALAGSISGGGLFALGVLTYYSWAAALALAVLAALWLFGFLYNRYIAALGTDLDGFTWLSVVIGVLVTLLGIGLLDLALPWNAGLISLLAFAASGFEMCRGAVLRYIQLRQRLRTL